MDGIKLVFSALLGLVIFAGILYLAYVSTKFIGSRYSLGGKGGKNLKIIESLAIGKESRLAIVKAGEKYLLLGITPHSISNVAELSEEEIKAAETQNSQPAEGMSFAEALKINLSKAVGKKLPEKNPDTTEDVNDDQSAGN